jgi:hypothetical protein
MQIVINTQKAVYALLIENLEPAIYDFVPENAALPYITIGDAALAKKPALGKNIYEVDIRLHAYGAAKGRKDLLELGQEIFDLLDSQFLDIEDFEHYETLLLDQTADLIEGGEKYELTASYRIIIGE